MQIVSINLGSAIKLCSELFYSLTYQSWFPTKWLTPLPLSLAVDVKSHPGSSQVCAMLTHVNIGALTYTSNNKQNRNICKLSLSWNTLQPHNLKQRNNMFRSLANNHYFIHKHHFQTSQQEHSYINYKNTNWMKFTEETEDATYSPTHCKHNANQHHSAGKHHIPKRKMHKASCSLNKQNIKLRDMHQKLLCLDR